MSLFKVTVGSREIFVAAYNLQEALDAACDLVNELDEVEVSVDHFNYDKAEKIDTYFVVSSAVEHALYN